MATDNPQSINLQTSHLQAELIIDDIQYSGKAYLRAIAVQKEFESSEETLILNQESDELLRKAGIIALEHQAKILLAGFRAGQRLLELPDQLTPPASFEFYTDFINMTAKTDDLRKQASAKHIIRRVPLTADRIRIFIDAHEAGMCGVPNVPFLTEDSVRQQLPDGNLHLVELPGGQLIGHYDLSIQTDLHSADLDEIAILPPWRNHGFGRQIIAEISEQLANDGILSLAILVASSNTGALRLYRRMGFAGEALYSRWFRHML